MPRIVLKCQATTISGKQCESNGKFDYNNKKVCRVHMNVMKSVEDCAICLSEMTSGARIRLVACGHFFHKSCLQKTSRPECPLCRTTITLKQCLDIFEDSCIEHVLKDTFSTPVDVQDIIINSFELINNISMINASEFTNATNFLLKALRSSCEQSGIENPIRIYKLINLFCQAVAYLNMNNTLIGFLATFDSDETLCL